MQLEDCTEIYPTDKILIYEENKLLYHMLRDFLKYVNYNDLKKFFSEFKTAYNDLNETDAFSELESIKRKWGRKYPYGICNWENSWQMESSFFLPASGVSDLTLISHSPHELMHLPSASPQKIL